MGLLEGSKAGLRLKELKLGRSRLENKGAKSVAAALAAMGTAEVLVLPQNGIKNEGIVALAGAVAKSPHLVVLNLNDNTFKAESSAALASALKSTPKLEVLDLGDCLVGTAGFVAIGASLGASTHTAIKTVDLSFNDIGTKSKALGSADPQTTATAAIVGMCSGKLALEKLTLDGNILSEESVAAISAAVAKATGKDDAGDALVLEDVEEPESDNEDEDDDDDDDDDGIEPDDEETVADDKKMVALLYSNLNSSTA